MNKRDGTKQAYNGRPPDAVIDERVSEAIHILSHRPTAQRSMLHKELCARWRCHWRTVDRIVSRAREEMMARLKRPREEFRCDSLAFYEAIMTDPKSSAADKIRARHRVDQLLGLDTPQRLELSGPDGGRIQVEEKKEWTFDWDEFNRLAREVRGSAQANGEGQSLHPAGADTSAGVVPGRNGH